MNIIKKREWDRSGLRVTVTAPVWDQINRSLNQEGPWSQRHTDDAKWPFRVVEFEEDGK